MQLIDGKLLSKKVQDYVQLEVETLKKEKGIVPGLAVVIVGDDPASHAYVSMKEKACKNVGFYSIAHKMPNTITQEEIIQIIQMMNNIAFYNKTNQNYI